MKGNARIRKYDKAKNTVSTIAGSGQHCNTDGWGTNASFAQPRFVALESTGCLLVCCEKAIRRIDLQRMFALALRCVLSVTACAALCCAVRQVM